MPADSDGDADVVRSGRRSVRETAALTDRPFCGNLVLTSDQHRRLDEALEAGLRIVSLFLGDPAGYVEPVHDANGLVLCTVGSAEEARRAVASGVDVIVAQGWEAGGHVGSKIATLPFVPAVVDAVAPVPVIAAGGSGTPAAWPPCSPSARRRHGLAPGFSWPKRCPSTRSIAVA